MVGTKFTTLNKNRDYVVIEKHKVFKDIWRCYPVNERPPYEQSLIILFATDFINECLRSTNSQT